MPEYRETGERLFALLWIDVTAPEMIEEEENPERVAIWIFRTREEAEEFAAQEALERMRLNQDQVPPAILREMEELVQKGDRMKALALWLYTTEQFFEEPEMAMVTDWPLMARA